MLRFSFAFLLGVVAAVAVGCAALANPTAIWQQSIVTITIVTLITATVTAAVCSGRLARCTALGMAVCGWIYLLIVFGPLLGVRESLLTDRCVGLLYQAIHDEDPNVAFPPTSLWGSGPNGGFISAGTVLWTVGNAPSVQQPFFTIGHSLWTLIIALAGGLLARWLSWPAMAASLQHE